MSRCVWVTCWSCTDSSLWREIVTGFTPYAAWLIRCCTAVAWCASRHVRCARWKRRRLVGVRHAVLRGRAISHRTWAIRGWHCRYSAAHWWVRRNTWRLRWPAGRHAAVSRWHRRWQSSHSVRWRSTVATSSRSTIATRWCTVRSWWRHSTSSVGVASCVVLPGLIAVSRRCYTRSIAGHLIARVTASIVRRHVEAGSRSASVWRRWSSWICSVAYQRIWAVLVSWPKWR